MRRAARFDGVFPLHRDRAEGGVMTPDDLRAATSFVRGLRVGDDPFDVVFSPSWPDNLPIATPDVVAAYADAGATWWLENIPFWVENGSTLQVAFDLARKGPPRVE